MSQQKISDKVPYAFGILGTIFLVYWYSQDLVLTSVLVSSVAGIALFLSVISYLFLRSGWLSWHEGWQRLEAGYDSGSQAAQPERAAGYGVLCDHHVAIDSDAAAN
jgi:hypothetical protein